MIENSDCKNITEGPNFLCIGMQKAGTGFFFQCLESIPGFRIPIHKELHHFDHYPNIHRGGGDLLHRVAEVLGFDETTIEGLGKHYRELKPRSLPDNTIRLGRRDIPLDEYNVKFLRKLYTYVSQGGGDQAYLDMFTPFRDFVSGDMTPAYSTLDHDTIVRVKTLLPRVKIILCVRDPVSRMWSQINMRGRRQLAKRFQRRAKATDIDAFEEELRLENIREWVTEDVIMSRSRATHAYRAWSEVYGVDNMLVGNFEDLIGKTEKVLHQTCQFLGVAPPGQVSLPGNSKGNALKTTLDDDRREVLIAALGDEVEAYEKLFSTHPDRV